MAYLVAVGINSAPEFIAIGPYTSRLARHAAEIRHAVTVVAGPQRERLGHAADRVILDSSPIRAVTGAAVGVQESVLGRVPERALGEYYSHHCCGHGEHDGCVMTQLPPRNWSVG